MLREIEEAVEVNDVSDNEEAVHYRKYTQAMLRRYFQLSLDLGRVPSVLGGQCFRAKVSSYRVSTFEDVVIFVSDMERCLEKLQLRELEMIAAIVLMDYTEEEAAKMLGMSERQVRRAYPESVDRLTAILLEAKLMRPRMEMELDLPPRKPVRSVRDISACAESVGT